MSLAYELSGLGSTRVVRFLSPRGGGSMNRTTWLQDRRMKKFRDVLSRWERKELSGLEASELLGISARQFRRYPDRCEEEGLAGLADKRLGNASAKRARVLLAAE